MKNQVVNKGVIKAISFGLSAAMAASPITAFAAEGGDDLQGNGASQEQSVGGEESQYVPVQEAVEEAKESTNGGEQIILDTAVEISIGEIIAVPDAAKAADAEVLEDVVTEETENGQKTEVTYTDVVNAEIAADKNLEASLEELEEAKEAEEKAAEEVSKADNALDIVEDNNQIIKEANTEVKDASAKVEEAVNQADKADTQKELDESVQAAEEALKEAEDAQKKAEEKYEESTAKLNEAELALDEAKKNLEEANASLTASKEEIAAAEEEVVKAAEYAEALQQEVNADKEALDQTKEAELSALYAAMLEAAKRTEIKEYDGAAASGTGVDDAFSEEFGYQKDVSTEYWGKSREYAQKALEYIFKDKDGVNVEFKQQGSHFAKENVYKITYTENGQEVTKLYNYHANTDGTITFYEKKTETKTVEAEDGQDAWVFTASDEHGNVTIKKADIEDIIANYDFTYVNEAKTLLAVENNAAADKTETADLNQLTGTVGTNRNITVSGQTESISWEQTEDGTWVKVVTTKGTVTVTDSGSEKVYIGSAGNLRDDVKLGMALDKLREWKNQNGISADTPVRYGYVEENGQLYLSIIHFVRTKTYHNQVIETKYYEAAAYENKKVKDVEVLKERKDTTYDNMLIQVLDEIKSQTAKLQEKLDAAAIAKAAADQAEKDVKEAKEALEALKVNDAEFDAALERYEEAKNKLIEAEEALKEIKEEVEEIKEKIEDINRVIPEDKKEETPVDGGTAPEEGTSPEGGAVPEAAVPEEEHMPEEGNPVEENRPAAAIRRPVTAEAEDSILIASADEEVPLGGNLEEMMEKEESKLVEVEEELVPLADMELSKGKMSWWWLLILALAVATGYKMYRDHQLKKEEMNKTEE